MKSKHLFSTIPFFLLCINAAAQKVETNIVWLTDIPNASNTIIYNPQQKLTIDDFKGPPEENSGAVAITSSGFMFKAGYHSKGEKAAALSIAVYCSFDKQQSWMKGRGKNAYILAHEQHHFDISYLNTLFFIKKVKQARFTQDEHMQQLKDIYREAVEKMEAMQHQYDDETNNGINTTKQEEWNKKIDALIAAAVKEPVL